MKSSIWFQLDGTDLKGLYEGPYGTLMASCFELDATHLKGFLVALVALWFEFRWHLRLMKGLTTEVGWRLGILKGRWGVLDRRHLYLSTL